MRPFIILLALICLAALIVYALRWAFIPHRRLPGNRVRHNRLRVRLRLHSGRGHATVFELWLHWGRFAAAALAKWDLTAVADWVLGGDATEAEKILRSSGHDQWAAQLAELRNEAQKTTATIRMTMSRALQGSGGGHQGRIVRAGQA